MWHKISVTKYDPYPFNWALGRGFKGISNIPWKVISSGFPSFSKFVNYLVGDESSTFFWEDCWVGNRPL